MPASTSATSAVSASTLACKKASNGRSTGTPLKITRGVRRTAAGVGISLPGARQASRARSAVAANSASASSTGEVRHRREIEQHVEAGIAQASRWRRREAPGGHSCDATARSLGTKANRAGCSTAQIAHVDDAMAGARIEADERRGLGRARALDREARAPARARCDVAAAAPSPRHRAHAGAAPRQPAALSFAHRRPARDAARRSRRMCRNAGRRGVARSPGAQQRDELGRLRPRRARPEPRAHAIAGRGEGQIDGAARRGARCRRRARRRCR